MSGADVAPSRQPSAAAAFGIYLALTIGLTWPLTRGLGSRIPLDLGDSLLNVWILSWSWDRLSELAHGHLGAFAGYWTANIFHPAPLTLAYSEHLFAQALQSWPVYALTGNGVLAYNLLFLTSFPLSGLGAYLFVRELTGDRRAAFVGGLCYAFAPYRAAHIGHLQVLSSQWLPFALFGLRRWLDAADPAHGDQGETRARWRRHVPLAGAVVALVAQNLSCGYYILFFSPFVAAYVLWELWRRGLWRSVHVWLGLGIAAAVVIAATLPFLLPYLELRRLGFGPRSLDEVRAYSADVYSYLRALDDSIWRWLLTDETRLEGTLFPGFVPVALAVVALFAAAGASPWRGSLPPWRGLLLPWRGSLDPRAALLARTGQAVTLSALALATFELFAGPRIKIIRDLWFPAALVGNVLAVAAIGAAIWLAASPRARHCTAQALREPAIVFLLAALAAAWLSFGPYVETKGLRLTEQSVYLWLYRYVPGFDGLRAAARFAMVVAFCLSVLAGLGAAVVLRLRRWGVPLLAGLCVLFLVEGASLPMPTTGLEWTRRDGSGLRPVVGAPELSRLYTFVAEQPRDAVVIEFPFGDVFDETRAVFFSSRHHHAIVNGYSGGFPASYTALRATLQDPLAHPDEAWTATVASGATTAVVHEWAFEPDRGRQMSDWLEARGARLIGTFNRDRVYRLK